MALPDPPWIEHAADYTADEMPLELDCPHCNFAHALPRCPACGSFAVTIPEPATPTHGQLVLRVAALEEALRQAITDIEADLRGAGTTTGAALALTGLRRALEGQS